MRLIVVAAVVEALRSLDLSPPAVSDAVKASFSEARAKLEAEG